MTQLVFQKKRSIDMDKNRELYLHQRPSGIPTTEDIRLREAPLPEPGDGEVLLRNLHLSLDPAQRDWMSDNVSYMPPIAIGEAIRSTTLGTVVSSRHPDFKPGDFALGLAANTWADYSCTAGDLLTRVEQQDDFPLHYHLSIFSGAMGLTPYFGMLELGQPRPGETALISAAAGAVGSIAGQIAKIKGCRVIGLTGSDDKGAWLTKELGFDGYINYRKEDDLVAAIGAACPEGVDIYFDNVGGAILDAALMNLARRARVVFCGAISTYNTSGPVPGPYNYWQILARSATVKGLLTTNYIDRFPAALEDIRGWLEAGQLKFAEDIVGGLENTVEAYARLFTGENRGKLLVRLTDDNTL